MFFYADSSGDHLRSVSPEPGWGSHIVGEFGPSSSRSRVSLEPSL
jgi:hypothetical protein